MEQFLSGPLFRYVVFPLAGAVLGIGVKHVTRNDRYAKFRKEDLAIGIELLLAACLTFVAATSDQAVALVKTNQELSTLLASSTPDLRRAAELQAAAASGSAQLAMAGWVIAAMFLSLWGISSVVRMWGWVNETDMHLTIGIALPLVVGVLALMAVMAGAR